MKIESIAECSAYSAILLTCIKRKSVLKTNFGVLLSDRLRQVLLYVLMPNFVVAILLFH